VPPLSVHFPKDAQRSDQCERSDGRFDFRCSFLNPSEAEGYFTVALSLLAHRLAPIGFTNRTLIVPFALGGEEREHVDAEWRDNEIQKARKRSSERSDRKVDDNHPNSMRHGLIGRMTANRANLISLSQLRSLSRSVAQSPALSESSYSWCPLSFATETFPARSASELGFLIRESSPPKLRGIPSARKRELLGGEFWGGSEPRVYEGARRKEEEPRPRGKIVGSRVRFAGLFIFRRTVPKKGREEEGKNQRHADEGSRRNLNRK